ncbi:Cys-every-fifth RiPP peptide CefA [Streptomyces sp. NPDC091371]|uniref:Cys-every-fifth RiPP peptide CefA n=1 Tax=Streptomyces sp. NPDC091371 TaxID=3155303 RepID=UPI00343823DB
MRYVVTPRYGIARTDACPGNVCGVDGCGENGCGADGCGANSCSHDVCGANGCTADGCGIDGCGGNLCGADLCAVQLCPADGCVVDGCVIDFIDPVAETPLVVVHPPDLPDGGCPIVLPAVEPGSEGQRFVLREAGTPSLITVRQRPTPDRSRLRRILIDLPW